MRIVLVAATIAGLCACSVENGLSVKPDGVDLLDLEPNLDTDGDGVPDTNLDTDGDGIADVDLDTDGDGIPDANIDVDGDGIPDVNLDTDGDGIPDVNIDADSDGLPDSNIDIDGDGTPDINIDSNGDGWPDTDIDLDGDGDPDVNIDTNGDGNPDVDIDVDGDGTPDINIDNDGDGIPDESIVEEDPDADTGGLTGRVCAPSTNTWVSDAEVRVTHAAGVAEGRTDGDGWFLVDGLATGSAVVDITKGSFSRSLQATVVAGQVVNLGEDECLEQGNVQILVVEGEYDDIGEVLDGLGLQYETLDGTIPNVAGDVLSDPTMTAPFDIIFLNCGIDDSWVASRPGVAANLSAFVAAGGSVYASDWSYDFVESAFPDEATFYGTDGDYGTAFVGLAQQVQGDVIDPGWQNLVGGPQADIVYDLSQWAVVASSQAQVLMEGTFTYVTDPQDASSTATMTAPLAFRIDPGDGTVIYTTFHNEQQVTFDMSALLEDMVLSL